MPEIVINDANYLDFVPGGAETLIRGERKSHGCIPRDHERHPIGCFAFAEPFPDELLIPEDQIDARIKQQEEARASLLDLREHNYDVLRSLDQNGYGLCWSFSTTILGLPCITDWNFWSHSVCAIKAKQWKPVPQLIIDNSWGEDAGDRGLYTLEGNHSRPDGLWIPRVTMPSPK